MEVRDCARHEPFGLIGLGEQAAANGTATAHTACVRMETESAKLRAMAAKARGLTSTALDPLTVRALTTYADECDADAEKLDGECDTATPPPEASAHQGFN